MKEPGKAIIIGAGIAGLAAATRLALQGWQVEVFEANSYPGGKLSWFEQDGYAFDAGPSLFTQPQLVEDLFRFAGVPIENYFSYRRAGETCRYFFSNGKKITAWAEPGKFAAEMQEVLGEDEKTVLRYLQRSQKLYTHIGEIFLGQTLHRLSAFEWSSVLKAIWHLKPAHLFSSMHGFNKRSFKTAEAVQLFNRYATYNGSNPYKAPAMLTLIPHLEMNEGTYYPEGGMISITNALYKLALDKGVQFHFNRPVQRIIHHAGKVKGVVVDGNNLAADVVVSNCDAYFTYGRLLSNEHKAKKLLKQERSSSALIFYWGISKSFDQLGLHNIFFSSNYNSEFHHLFQTKTFYDDPTVYINITSKMETGQAPAGKENWFVMVNAPANTGQPWQEWIPQMRKRVLTKLSDHLQTNLEMLIETEAVLDPPTIESRTASYMGSLYGTSSNARMSAFLRHPNFSESVKGLYFVGGSVHPGGGIPLCLRSAAITAQLIAKDYRIPVSQ